MAYDILAKDGCPIKKDGDPVKAMDYTVEKIEQLDETNKTFVAVASTEDEDRDKDIIRQDGWNLKNFKKNPMIPWSHDYWGIPIGKSLRTWVDKATKRLLFKPQFDEFDDTSMKIWNKFKNGFLTSFSVGFRGLEFEWRDEENKWGGGMEFLKQELLEISAVTIPANPNATVHLNAGDVNMNLLQLGYPQKFAETEHGLFYPIRSLGEYTNPEVKKFESEQDGITAVHACSIDDDNEIIIGYFFDQDSWSTGDITKWVTENNGLTYKQWYYDWKWLDNDENNWEVKKQEEEVDILIYNEDPIKMTISSSSDDDTDDQTDDQTDIDAIKKVLDEALGKFNETLEKGLEAISNGVEKAFEKFNEGLSEIKSLLNEKIVDSNSDTDDTDSDDLEIPDDDKSNSKSDDEIEIDDSLLSPDNDKSNNDDEIELDVDLLSDEEAGKIVKSVFGKKLKETLKEVKDSFKIEV